MLSLPKSLAEMECCILLEGAYQKSADFTQTPKLQDDIIDFASFSLANHPSQASQLGSQ